MDNTHGTGVFEAASQLLAFVAHEIRNPLGNMTNVVTLLEREPQNVNLVLDCTQIMKRQVNLITRLVEDLFDLTAIEQGKMNLKKEPVAVNHLMQLVVDDNTCQMETKDHSFELELLPEDATIQGDSTRLFQVFSNLLGNAAKYTPIGGHISLSVRREGDEAVIRVKDNGIGIRPESLESIFELFSQELRVSNKIGLGLGLTLVRKMVGMHGGTVSAYSDGPGQGAMFEVRLPIEDKDYESPLPHKSRKILIVEDNVNAGDTLKKIIEFSGDHDVKLVRSGQDAIKESLESHAEFLLLDVGLPDMSGGDVARLFRKNLPAIRIVAMTGYPQDDTDGQWFDYYIGKPLDYSSLFRILSA